MSRGEARLLLPLIWSGDCFHRLSISMTCRNPGVLQWPPLHCPYCSPPHKRNSIVGQLLTLLIHLSVICKDGEFSFHQREDRSRNVRKFECDCKGEIRKGKVIPFRCQWGRPQEAEEYSFCWTEQPWNLPISYSITIQVNHIKCVGKWSIRNRLL